MRREAEVYFEKNLSRILEEWKAFLRFPSVSSMHAHDKDCISCAKWLVSHLQRIGCTEAKLVETSGKPLVYASHPGFAKGPSTLYYGHYDVYEPGNEEDWLTPPFEPDLRQSRMYARGAEDNKGQSFFVIKALEYLIEKRQLRGPVKLLLEGEEETTTSPALYQALPRLQKILASDELLVCDTDSQSPEQPSLVLGIRGIIHFCFAIHGPSRPLHSGVYGGVVGNPTQELIRILHSMFNAHGEIQVPGFLAGISEPNEEDLVLAELSSPSAESIARETGFDPRLSASRTSLAKRRGFLPTLEVNALASENIPSQEIQTIIPAFAQAQLTARLVPGQNPGSCLRALEDYIHEMLSPGFRLEIRDKGIGGPGLHLPRTCAATERATRCIEELFSCEPRFAWEGMSIPILPTLLNGFAREAVLCGFGLDDDNTHGPNESFSLEQFKAGFLFVARYLADDAFISSDVNEGLGI